MAQTITQIKSKLLKATLDGELPRVEKSIKWACSYAEYLNKDIHFKKNQILKQVSSLGIKTTNFDFSLCYRRRNNKYSIYGRTAEVSIVLEALGFGKGVYHNYGMRST